MYCRYRTVNSTARNYSYNMTLVLTLCHIRLTMRIIKNYLNYELKMKTNL